ncbi:MAG: hypothetical protein HC896_10265, partial [Bacteroidales bacterium]|nr:hypothetical protein [Bacteroidales bacterium]
MAEYGIATRNSRLTELNSKLEAVHSVQLKNRDPKYPDSQFNSIVAIDQDKDHNLWLGTQYGLVKYNTLNHTVSYKNNLFYGNSQRPGITIKCLSFDSYGALWLGTEQGLYCFHPVSDLLVPASNDVFITKKLAAKDVRSLYIDNSGVLWTGAFQQKLEKHPLGNTCFNFYSFPASVNSETEKLSVYAIGGDGNGNVWFGTLNGAVCRFSKQTGKTDMYYDPFPTDSVLISQPPVADIISDYKGNVWVASMGVYLMHINTVTGNRTFLRKT